MTLPDRPVYFTYRADGRPARTTRKTRRPGELTINGITTILGRGIGHTRDVAGSVFTFAGPAARRLIRRAAARGVGIPVGFLPRLNGGFPRLTGTGPIPVVRIARVGR